MRENQSPARTAGPARGRRGRLVLLSLTVAASVLAPAAATGATTRSSAPPSVAGTTTIVGDSTAAMRVDLPRRASLNRKSGPNPDIRISGDGRLIGVVLTKDNVTDYNRETFQAVRFGYCAERGCSPAKTSDQLVSTRPGDGEPDPEGTIVLEPGSYLLYLIADGAPVTVELRFHGLEGSTVMRLAGKAHSGLVMPTAANSTTTPGDDTFWYGEEVDIKGAAGIIIAVLRMDVENWVDIHYGDCAYEGTRPANPVAYSPVCPGGISVYYNEMTPVPSSHSFEVPIMSEILAGGRFGYGIYHSGAVDVTDRHTMFFHLSLDPALS